MISSNQKLSSICIRILLEVIQQTHPGDPALILDAMYKLLVVSVTAFGQSCSAKSPVLWMWTCEFSDTAVLDVKWYLW